MTSASLVYPHQLFDRHPALRVGQPVLLVEDPLYFGTDPRWPLAVHKQRLVLHRASMKAWAAGQGNLRYIEAPERGIGSVDLLEREVPAASRRIEVADPCDAVLSKRLRRFATGREAVAPPHDGAEGSEEKDNPSSHHAHQGTGASADGGSG